MTWFLNKATGLKWEITSEDVVSRISKHENYELIEVSEAKDQKADTTKSKNTTKK